MLDDPVLLEIAGRYGKSVAQVVLRWQIQHGNIVFPKSVKPERIRENIAIFDFALEPTDVETIDALDRGEAGRNGPNPDTFAYVPELRVERVARRPDRGRGGREACGTPVVAGSAARETR